MPLILAIDTSAKPVSCALVRDGVVLSSFYSNTGLTHSQTLMPMVEDTLRIAGVSIRDVDALAVNAGPGSFTGVRIGVSAVKGLAFADEKPCVSVSTLESMAENTSADSECLVCCVMDARCQQVYTALFSVDEQGNKRRVCDDRAVSINDLKNELIKINKSIILVGDGSEMCYNTLKNDVENLYLAPPSVRFQSAAATGLVAERMLLEGRSVRAEKLLPIYLRLPQAERELNNRLGQK